MNLPIKYGTNPSTIFLVTVVTDRQTHKPTLIKTYSSLSWENNLSTQETEKILSCRLNKRSSYSITMSAEIT